MAYSSPKQYDVFISFRGEDARSNFVSHLRSALSRDNIKTCMDDQNLEKGDEVWPSLSQAIHDSYVAIVVFSQNYASSKWCLKELVHILKCRKSEGLVVIPVFYEVDPSDIRKHTGTYGEAIAKHEKNFGEEYKESIKEWKDALTEAANISGWDSRSRDYKNEAEIIERIVEDVLEKLNLRFPNELKVESLVQIDQICEEVKLLLENVKVIGIWGMGGIGKTTIAKALFSQIFPPYDSVCFLANVREESKRSGLTSLHDKILSKLLNDERHRSNVAGSAFIARRLSDRKVLIVLDDVDSLDQLEELCGECKYAGPGSKIIVTTRDRHLLISAGADEIYDVKTLSKAESLELFSLHAFKQRHPKKGYGRLSRRAVDYAEGVPLALKVLGSNLCSRSPEFWDSELNKLMKFPDDKIQSVLQVSYDGLDSVQKKIFLDIAFFFKGEDKYDVIRILDACGFYATSGVQVLVDKALINISYDERIQMHDLIQEMGLNLVRQGIEDPGNRSRLIYAEEVSDVLENKKGSDAVEGIKLDLSEIDDLQLDADSFNKMNNLRILILHIPSGKKSGNMHYPMAINKLSGKLRYLEWKACGLKSLPASFSAKMLVEIRMTHSHVTELWPGVKDVVNLVRIDLSECTQLKNLPNLSKASKLEWLNLSGCENLVVVHPSVLSLDTLKTLILDGCKKLESLKGVKHLTSLAEISVNGCIGLREFSVSSDSINILDLSNTGLEELDSSIGRLRNLRRLSVQGLRRGSLPGELSFLEHLYELKICNCSLAIDKEKLHVVFDGLTCLQYVTLEDCHNLCELPDNIGNLSKLEVLRLDGSSVKTLPTSIKHLTNMEILSVKNCKELGSLPKLPSNVSKLEAINCTSLVTVSGFGVEMGEGETFISFENCTSLVTISSFRVEMGYGRIFISFENCTSLATVFSFGVEMGDGRIFISFKNCTSLGTVSGFGVKMEEGRIFISFENCASLVTVSDFRVKMEEGRIFISFENCASLVTVSDFRVELGRGVPSISFENCTSLVTISGFRVELERGETSISFENCTSLVIVSSFGVKMEEGRIFISFENCTSLVTVSDFRVELARGVPSISFENCTSLVTVFDFQVELGRGETPISFENCASLVTVSGFGVKMEEGRIFISFENCTSLVTVSDFGVKMEEGKISISFENCASLVTVSGFKVKLVRGVPSISFENCTSLVQYPVKELK